MIRPFTVLCVLLAGASGMYLYTAKHRTTVLDQQISQVAHDTQAIRERTAMLRAEWALLNQPDRLQALASRFLPHLHPLAPGQFVQMTALAQHLPQIDAAPAAPAAPEPASDAAPLLAAATPAPGSAPVAASVQQVMARSLVPSADEPEPEPSARDEDAPRVHAPRPQTRRPRAMHAPTRFAALNPPASTPMRIATRMASYEAGAAPMLLRRFAAPRPEAMRTGSSLGFARATLPAPVPVQDEN